MSLQEDLGVVGAVENTCAFSGRQEVAPGVPDLTLDDVRVVGGGHEEVVGDGWIKVVVIAGCGELRDRSPVVGDRVGPGRGGFDVDGEDRGPGVDRVDYEHGHVADP